MAGNQAYPRVILSPEEAMTFVLRHFEEFVNQQDLSAADRNFDAGYQEHGADVPPGLPPGPEGPKQYRRVGGGKLLERWAYLQAPHPVH